MLAATYIYTMMLDFIVMCLAGWKLFVCSSGQSRLGNLLVRDGLGFFVVAFVANMMTVVRVLLLLSDIAKAHGEANGLKIFLELNYNPVVSIIFNVPAGLASTVCLPLSLGHLSLACDHLSLLFVIDCSLPSCASTMWLLSSS